MVRAFANALALSGALLVASCSLVLGWDGYAGGPSDGGDEASDAADAGALDAGPPDAPKADAPSQAPPCGPKTCGGCCNAQGFCAGGESNATCGTGGEACTDCTRSGRVCGAGTCTTVPPAHDAQAPTCDVTACQMMFRCPAVVYSAACCLSDGTCGCQVQIPQVGPCM